MADEITETTESPKTTEVAESTKVTESTKTSAAPKATESSETTESTESTESTETLTEFTSETAPVRGKGTSEIAPGAGLGRRKEAVARVRLVPGTGKWLINGRELEHYFPNRVHQQIVNSPFAVLDIEEKFDVHARIHGGGPSGQAGALRLGVARALNGIDLDTNRATLKKSGFLTRDPRAVERKKAGLKKARRAPQYSKR
jgi:small subunit ribosomal protein S9